MARFVEREIRADLDCGVLANAFLRIHCADCGCDRLVQWAFTMPYPLRLSCAWDAKRTSAVPRAFLRSVFADQRRRATQVHGVRNGQCAAVTFFQRFGSALNLTPHFRRLVLDGVYPGPAHAPGSFLPLPPPETEDVAHVMGATARRVMRLVESRGQRDDRDDGAA